MDHHVVVEWRNPFCPMGILFSSPSNWQCKLIWFPKAVWKQTLKCWLHEQARCQARGPDHLEWEDGSKHTWLCDSISSSLYCWRSALGVRDFNESWGEVHCCLKPIRTLPRAVSMLNGSMSDLLKRHKPSSGLIFSRVKWPPRRFCEAWQLFPFFQ